MKVKRELDQRSTEKRIESETEKGLKVKYIQARSNGVFNASDILEIPYEDVETIILGETYIIKTEEPIRYFIGDNLYHEEKGKFFLINEDFAYPFSMPFYPEDEEEGIEAQELPETWEDAIALIESFGRG